uniref:Uncharacterized protein n=1 Tax=Setaria italica TaxID=4555 RepID=K3ZG60_SETIT
MSICLRVSLVTYVFCASTTYLDPVSSTSVPWDRVPLPNYHSYSLGGPISSKSQPAFHDPIPQPGRPHI